MHGKSSTPTDLDFRTLDQYGYPSLRNTEARDIDQVLYKRTKIQEMHHVAPRDPSMCNIGSILHAVRGSGPRPSRIRTVGGDMGATVLMIGPNPIGHSFPFSLPADVC